jgi:hypothetical protein
LPVGDVETLEAQLEQSNVSSSGMFWNFVIISLEEFEIEGRIKFNLLFRKYIVKVEDSVKICLKEMEY